MISATYCCLSTTVVVLLLLELQVLLTATAATIAAATTDATATQQPQLLMYTYVPVPRYRKTAVVHNYCHYYSRPVPGTAVVQEDQYNCHVAATAATTSRYEVLAHLSITTTSYCPTCIAINIIET